MNNKHTIWYIAAGIVALVAIFIFSLHAQKINPSTSSGQAAMGTIGNLQKGTPPWPAEFDHLRQRLTEINLPALSQEGTALHIHQHLDIDIEGTTVAVPAGIGIDPNEQFIAPIHVHDNTGIMHVESPTIQNFTLGQFFDIWGLTFTDQCIGGKCTNDSESLRVYVNGTLYQGDPRSIVLAAHQELFIFYGTTAQLPKTIPSSYTFPADY
ncbi:MAG TPA: hypothetical protein VL576_02620 [Candidatus Paceibacterota bacterium]|jgi:hypothetical protein|nr:hypothetical protein [Candidatus Paceibacterota bacterium]